MCIWRRQWHPTPAFLPGKSHGWRSLAVCSPWSHDTTERLQFHLSLSCTGEGNGNPLQCSCLENPRDGGAWWAAVHRVAQGRTRLKRLSSGSSSSRACRILVLWNPAPSPEVQVQNPNPWTARKFPERGCWREAFVSFCFHMFCLSQGHPYCV